MNKRKPKKKKKQPSLNRLKRSLLNNTSPTEITNPQINSYQDITFDEYAKTKKSIDKCSIKFKYKNRSTKVHRIEDIRARMNNLERNQLSFEELMKQIHNKYRYKLQKEHLKYLLYKGDLSADERQIAKANRMKRNNKKKTTFTFKRTRLNSQTKLHRVLEEKECMERDSQNSNEAQIISPLLMNSTHNKKPKSRQMERPKVNAFLGHVTRPVSQPMLYRSKNNQSIKKISNTSSSRYQADLKIPMSCNGDLKEVEPIRNVASSFNSTRCMTRNAKSRPIMTPLTSGAFNLTSSNTFACLKSKVSSNRSLKRPKTTHKRVRGGVLNMEARSKFEKLVFKKINKIVSNVNNTIGKGLRRKHSQVTWVNECVTEHEWKPEGSKLAKISQAIENYREMSESIERHSSLDVHSDTHYDTVLDKILTRNRKRSEIDNNIITGYTQLDL